VLLARSADGSYKLPPLVADKCKVQVILRMLKMPTECGANTISWMDTVVFDEYLAQLDRKMNAKNKMNPVLLLISVLLTQGTQPFSLK
jgi:hypothetical protein